MSRRANGEGSIYQRRDGRWCGVVSTPDGGRKTFYGRTRNEVARRLSAALRDLEKASCRCLSG
jgi:integrase